MDVSKLHMGDITFIVRDRNTDEISYSKTYYREYCNGKSVYQIMQEMAEEWRSTNMSEPQKEADETLLMEVVIGNT